MSKYSLVTGHKLLDYLRQAQALCSPASIRMEKGKLLGDLRLLGIEPGFFLSLGGAKVRDVLPLPGSLVSLAILVADSVLTLEGEVLDCGTVPGLQNLREVRIAWPSSGMRLSRRNEIRVAAPDQAPLVAQVQFPNQLREAKVLNLTETGVGLAFHEIFLTELHTRLQLAVTLPDGTLLECPGEVRNITSLDGTEWPYRLGVVLMPPDFETLAPLRRFVQERRMDRSETIRRENEERTQA